MHDHWLVDLSILTLLLGLFFGYGLGNRALWAPDEGRYSEVAREMVESGDYITPRLDGVKFFEKSPFFYWSQSLALKWFGLNEWSMRLVPAIFALLGCLSVYVCGRRLFGRWSAWYAAMVLATSGLHYAPVGWPISIWGYRCYLPARWFRFCLARANQRVRGASLF